MANKVKGITERKNSFQFTFQYQGRVCRETWKVPPNSKSREEAANMLAAIKLDIARGNFEVSKYFPDSRTRLAQSQSRTGNKTIKRMVDDWLRRNQKNLAYSTLRNYISKIRSHIDPNFGHMLISEFKPTHFKDWQSNAVQANGSGKPLSPKSIIDVRSILTSAFDELYMDEEIDSNPMHRVKRLTRTKPEPEPFTPVERELILAEMTGSVRNMFEFAFWTGLRIGELLGLRHKDVDLELGVIYIRNNIVHGRAKGPKTNTGIRTHKLDDRATPALKREISAHNDEHERIFRDPATNAPWKEDTRIRKYFWIPALKQAGVKYRSQRFTRHTYASTLITEGSNPAFIAKQLGHSTPITTHQAYARWIESFNASP